MQICQPALRPVNTQLFTATEKELLQNVIAILLSFSMNFVQEKSAEGQYVYKFDPNIEEVAYFPDMQHPQLPYAIKQLIAHEVDKEKMRRGHADQISEVKKVAAQAKPDEEAAAPIPSHLRYKIIYRGVSYFTQII